MFEPRIPSRVRPQFGQKESTLLVVEKIERGLSDKLLVNNDN